VRVSRADIFVDLSLLDGKHERDFANSRASVSLGLPAMFQCGSQ